MNTETAPSPFVEIPHEGIDDLRWLASESVARAVDNIDSGPESMNDVIWAAWALGAIGMEFECATPGEWPEGPPARFLRRSYVEHLLESADDLEDVYRDAVGDARTEQGRAHWQARVERVRHARTILEAAR